MSVELLTLACPAFQPLYFLDHSHLLPLQAMLLLSALHHLMQSSASLLSEDALMLRGKTLLALGWSGSGAGLQSRLSVFKPVFLTFMLYRLCCSYTVPLEGCVLVYALTTKYNTFLEGSSPETGSGILWFG